MRLIRSYRGQALAEFALVIPMFLLLLFSIITFGLYVFYNQQLENAAREAARYAAVHSSSAQCPTVSRLDPVLSLRPASGSYNRCDAPEGGWPDMTGAARSAVWGMPSNQVTLSACWSGYLDAGTDTFPGTADDNYDALPQSPNTFTECTINGVNPRGNPSTLACPAPATVASTQIPPKADGDDKASNVAAAPGNVHYPTTVTVYTCFNWKPPMAGFVIIPSQITLRAVITEPLQRQQ
jgi:hypothetical protein